MSNTAQKIDFAGFATAVIGPETKVALRAGAGAADLARASEVALDRYGDLWRLDGAETARLSDLLAEQGPLSVRAATEAFPAGRAREVTLTLVWLAKLGIVEWLD